MNLDKLFKPKTIAVVGASEKAGFNYDTCVNLLKGSRSEHVYFINPRREELLGKKCYNSVLELPEKVDLGILCVSKKIVPSAIEDLAKMGCMAAVIYASGYSEEGSEEGKQLEQELVEQCKKHGIAAVGPNCAGVANFIDNMFGFAFELDRIDRRGGIGFVSQSGQVCLSLMDIDHMTFSYIVSSGNSSIINMEDYLEYFVDDNDTKVVAAYIEGIKNPQKFTEILKKAAMKRKPVIMLKTGKSAKGVEIASAHTGSLAGADEAFNAVFKKFGVIRVDDMDELLQTAMLFNVLDSLPRGTSFASINMSGGETGITADVAHQFGIEFGTFTDETMAVLREILPSYATPNNPLDITATVGYHVDAYARALRTVMDDPNVDMVLMGYTIIDNILPSNCIYPMLEAVKKVHAEGNLKPMAIPSFVESTRNREMRAAFEKLNVPILPSSVPAYKVLRYLIDFVSYRYEEKTLELAICEQPLAKGTVSLSERESKEVLAKYDIRAAKEALAASEAELRAAANHIGYPLALKVDSPDILHKTEANCVKLNIMSEEDAVGKYHEILANARNYNENARINGISVQEMLPKGMEIIVGVKNDPIFGPMVLCGLGGIFVEVFKDVVLYPAPFNKDEALQMIASLKSYKIMGGFRGQAAMDIDALADVMVKVSRFAAENRNSLKELDINPLFLYEKGVCVADALVILAGAE